MVFSRLSKAAVQVDNREPEQISIRQMTSEVSSGHYMSLVKARQSSGSPEVIPSVDASLVSIFLTRLYCVCEAKKSIDPFDVM